MVDLGWCPGSVKTGPWGVPTQLPGHLLHRGPEARAEKEPLRVPGTAVYLTSRGDMVPTALLHNLKHNKVLHERVVLLTVQTPSVPRVPHEERVAIDKLRPDVIRMRVRYGFMQTPHVPRALDAAAAYGLSFEPMQTSYFLGRETLIPSIHPPLSGWQERQGTILNVIS